MNKNDEKRTQIKRNINFRFSAELTINIDLLLWKNKLTHPIKSPISAKEILGAIKKLKKGNNTITIQIVAFIIII